MKISVITVCFNAVETIRATIKSVSEQDCENVEHIIIDGDSTDGSKELIESYRTNLSHFVSEPDKGIYDAMNKGLEFATGDIICFLNADDWYASSKILSIVKTTMENFKLDALFGDAAFVNSKNPNKIIRRYRSDRFTPERLGWGWMPAHPSLFLRKEVIQRVGGFNETYRIAGDFEFIIRIFHNQTLYYKHLKEVMVFMHTGGVSNAGWRTKVQLNKEVLRACRENGVRSNVFMLLSKYPLKLMEFF